MPGTTSETLKLGATIVATEGTEKVLVKIDGSKPFTSDYLLNEASGVYRLFVSNTFKSKDGLRNYISLKYTQPATLTTDEVVTTVTVSIDGPMAETTALGSQIMALAAWLSTANVEKLRGGQS